MLTKKICKKVMDKAREINAGLTFCTTKGNGTYLKSYKGLPCYGSVIYYMQHESGPTFFTENNLAVFWLGPNLNRRVLFKEDSPFTALLGEVFAKSYMDEFDHDEFIDFVCNEGLILETDVIKNWCAASFMALVMAVRDIHRIDPDRFFVPEYFRRSYHYNSSFFPVIPKEIDYKTDWKAQPIYDSLPNDLDTRQEYFKSFLTVPLSTKLDLGWTSGTDTAQWVVTGFAVASTPHIRRFNERNRQERDNLYWKEPHRFKSGESIRAVYEKTDLYKNLVEALRKAMA